MYTIDLSGKTAVVTGGGAGLMRQCAIGLAEAGADVCIGDVNIDGAEQTAARITALDRQAIACKCDVTKHKDMQDLFRKAYSLRGQIDIVINGAGIVYMANIEETTEEGIRREIDINVMGVEFGSKLAFQYMKMKKQGVVVNISSVAGRKGTLPHPHYAMTKAAVINLTKSYAMYAAPYGIRYNSLLPGIVRTNMWENILDKMAGEDPSLRESTFEERIKAWIPMGTPQGPEDIANAAVFLVSDKARYITGQAINVDGGQVMY